MTATKKRKPDRWHNCYDGTWKSLITDDAFAHPAKFSRQLIGTIYAHAKEHGWIRPGSVVLDPFGGVALGALDAMFHGCTWVGCELEERFHKLGNANLDLWRSRWAHSAGWGRAVLLNGDSRRLGEVVGKAMVDVVASSPPFMDARQDTTNSKPTKKGGPCADRIHTVNGVDAVCASPPYVESSVTGERNFIGGGGNESAAADVAQGYSSSPGQLGAMPSGDVDAVISSPPFAAQQTGGGIAAHNGTNGNIKTGTNCGYQNQATSPGNLADAEDDTFWSASRLIVKQCFNLLRPGGHAIWVVKDFVRKGKIVDFCDQWRRLCEACGFVTLHCHHAMLVKDLGSHTDLYGDVTQKRKERKSFFRRLAEKKGSPRIDWETVWCMVKPGSDGGGDC